MADDAEYAAFLDKANRDLSEGEALGKTHEARGTAVFKATDAGTQAPEGIRKACADAVFVTEADEPFQEVSLKWDGDGLPDQAEFANLIQHWDADAAEISILDPMDWDSQGRYVELVDAVREATMGNDVRVYRVVRDKTRCEYWLVSREEGRLVGAKALGVES
ncbi:hypothetical protein E4U42_005016 [Claviceps africana]|uniref:Uncharacterized protein n=1 Tax=Claviceps africana TaxID=83212 RepID=A0A8K0J5B8_9HYPO|nr:hypothetical protein E4U42_005016 [Claviceps africana]